MKELRRQDRKSEEEDVIELLEKGEYGILSTVDNHGYPYGVPLNYTYMENSLYFHSALEGHKLDNILYNNKVSFCVVGQTTVLPEKFTTRYESIVIFGKAVEVSGEEKVNALMALIKKYSSAHMEKGEKYVNKDQDKTMVIKITIEKITGKARR